MDAKGRLWTGLLEGYFPGSQDPDVLGKPELLSILLFKNRGKKNSHIALNKEIKLHRNIYFEVEDPDSKFTPGPICSLLVVQSFDNINVFL